MKYFLGSNGIRIDFVCVYGLRYEGTSWVQRTDYMPTTYNVENNIKWVRREYIVLETMTVKFSPTCIKIYVHTWCDFIVLLIFYLYYFINIFIHLLFTIIIVKPNNKLKSYLKWQKYYSNNKYNINYYIPIPKLYY